MPLSLDEIVRYDRQLLLPEWGAAGQERVRAATVRLRGRGGAATTAARYLAGAGVGRLVVDEEEVAVAARALGPFVEVAVAAAILPRVPETPGQPEPDPPSPEDPEHPDRPAPETPLPEIPEPDEPAVVEVGRARIVAAVDREAEGAALALEALKAILGLAHRTRVALPSLFAARPEAA